MSRTSPRGQALAAALRDSAEAFDDAPVGSIVDPCVQDVLDIFFDDPFWGPCRDVLVRLVYELGPGESKRTDLRGAVRIKKKGRGRFADTSYRREGETQKRRVFLAPEQASTQSAAWQRLVNLGYVLDPAPPLQPGSPMKLFRALQAFQADFQLEVTGTLDETTRLRIQKEHDDRAPWPNREWSRPPTPSPEDANVKGSIT